MRDLDQLRTTLRRIDRRGYKAYQDIAGDYRIDRCSTLHVDHVQGDPFAAPSKLRLRISQSEAAFPPALFDTYVRRLALADFLARRVELAIRRLTKGHRGSGKSGRIDIDVGGQEVLERTAILVTDGFVEARIQAGLPAAGRSVLARDAEAMLCEELPGIARHALCWNATPREACECFVHCVDNQEAIRDQLASRGLVAFVADGSVLPRASGATDQALEKDAIVFRSDPSLRVDFDLPHPVMGENGPKRSIAGLGVPKGITLVVGGGYHGKSTLLQALQRGVYPHIPGDGREYVVTDPDAVKIRAEDGRRVENVDISTFIDQLPQGRGTTDFCSDDASGSTSQAANIVEALEVGAQVLLLDEDTSATNFMVRDARMQALVNKQHEPITPFLDRVRELYEQLGVSSVLVMGGCGDYFDVADTVILMRDYLPSNVTEEARRVASEHPTQRRSETSSPLRQVAQRMPIADSFDPSRGRRSVKIDAKSVDLIFFGEDDIELRCVEQLLDRSQTRAVGYAIHRAASAHIDGRLSLGEVLDLLEDELDASGLDGLDPFRRGDSHPGNFARPRRYEIAAAINRLRTVRVRRVE